MLFFHLPPVSKAMNVKPAQGGGWKLVRNTTANFRIASSHALWNIVSNSAYKEYLHHLKDKASLKNNLDFKNIFKV